MDVEDFKEQFGGDVQIFINKHTLERSKERVGRIDFSEIKSFEIGLQKYKNGLEINQPRILIRTSNAVLVGNLYKKFNYYFIKIITVLTPLQQIISKNFGFNLVLPTQIEINPKIILKDKYFYNYKEPLKDIDMSKVSNQLEDSNKKEYDYFSRKYDVGIGKYKKVLFRGGYIALK